MSLLEELTTIADFGNSFIKDDPRDLTDAQRYSIYDKNKADRKSHMESLMKNETDPEIKDILKGRLIAGVYEYEDLYK